LTSSVLQFLLFGSADAFLFANGSSKPLPVIALFVVMEMGVMASLCSLIFEQFHTSRLSCALRTVVVGFVVSHVAILAVLRTFAPFTINAADGPGRSTLAWMELTMQVGLLVILLSVGFAMLRPNVERRRGAALHYRGPDRRGA
jgi:hypothetical protein